MNYEKVFKLAIITSLCDKHWLSPPPQTPPSQPKTAFPVQDAEK